MSSTSCPLPDRNPSDVITLAHGEGGRLMRELLRDEILPALANDLLRPQADAALLPLLNGPPVFTTDSYVVSPRFFPGGDIGSLAVFGTANDLAVAGARPRFISLAFILEEGFSRSELRQILASIADAARLAGVVVAAGDTKVVPRGACDGLFINTSGIGELCFPMPGPGQLVPADEILVSGPIARHGMAVLAAREQLGFEPPLESDTAPLFPAVEALRRAGVPVTALRDATRGGVAAVLHEWAAACGHSFAIEETAVPLADGVRGASELLGLDPLHVACEGTMVVAVSAGHGRQALEALRRAGVSAAAARVGEVVPATLAPVLVHRALQRLVPLDEPAGAPLPRIC
jgi:hydrogenase expression/formation protein HypE